MNARVKVTTQIITNGVGAFVALLIALVVSRFSHIAAAVVFLVLFGVWVAISVGAERHQVEARGGRLGVLLGPKHWNPESLPLEFRFITPETPLQEVLTKIGSPSKRPPIPRDAVRYDSPDGRVIFIYSDGPGSTVSAIQVFARPNDIPIDEFI